MAKAKPKKHTAAEIAAKAKAATQNVGGGKAGLADRKGGSVGHAKFKCHICAQTAPDLKTMQIHHDAKHPKLPWEPEKCTDMHAQVGGVTVQGVAVRGSKKNTAEDGEAGLGGGGSPGGGEPPHLALLGSEAWTWEGVANLDQFFTRIYRYWEGKGFAVILTARVLNLLALAFTIGMSALLLLYVNWGALQAECLRKDTCDIWEVAIRRHPLAGGLTPWTALSVIYLTLFAAYWLVALAHLVVEVRDLAEIRHFCNHKLGISERQMGTMTWPEVAHRLVQVQRTHRLCAARDLTEHDIVARIMRRENYLIGMLNKGVLALNVPVPGLRRHFLLTKTLEWNLYWCILDAMFDERFRLKPAFLHNERALQRRLRMLALVNLVAAPFLLVFLVIYFFMKNAERFYHHPSSIGARRWSPLAQWRLREFNELPHFIKHRLNASHKAAEEYIQQFPSPTISHVARFVAFVAGSTEALLLFVTLLDERLLERDLFGRQIVWWVAIVGVVLALSRAFVIEAGTAFDPEAALMEVVAHTHYLPRHWRGRAHSLEVQQEFEALFQFKARLFLEELASILLTPLLLWFSLPQCAGAVLEFVEGNSVHIEGVGDVCSLAAFDFQRHGNARYGSPVEAPKAWRSRQGKMEKSLITFAATYPAWEPDTAGQQVLAQVAAAVPAAAASGSLAWSMLPVPHQQQGRRQGPPSPRHHKLAAALAAARRVRPGGAPAESGIFGSADFTAQEQAGLRAAPTAAGAVAAGLEANLAASLAADLAPVDGLAASQLMLQSLYEQREQQQAQQAQVQQHAGPGLAPVPAAVAAAGAAAASPLHQALQQQQRAQPRRQQGFAAVQAPLPIPQQAPTSSRAGTAAQPASASPLHALLASPSSQAAPSPRQPWHGRSPSGRPLLAELATLSRENSSMSAAGPPANGQGAQPLSVSPQLSESLLQQHLLHESGLGGALHHRQHAAHDDAAGGSGSHSDGPPEFF